MYEFPTENKQRAPHFLIPSKYSTFVAPIILSSKSTRALFVVPY